MDPCTPDEHVYAGWMIGATCRCGGMAIKYDPARGVMYAESTAAPPPPVEAPVDPVDAELAADAAQAEAEAEGEAEGALAPHRRTGRKGR